MTVPPDATIERWSADGVVATPHHLASVAGAVVLADGGTAVDAAVAAGLVLSVVTPYHCGLGGDLVALYWDGSRLDAYLGIGRAGRACGPDRVRRLAARGSDPPATVPSFDALAVTVPGATAGWFDLLRRGGQRAFADLVAPALRYAADGFLVSAHAAEYFAAAGQTYRDHPSWHRAFGAVRAGMRFRQPELARALTALASDGPDAFYRGPIGEALVRTVADAGGLLVADDLAEHTGEWTAPIAAAYRDVEVWTTPPPTRGMVTLLALGVVEALGPAAEDPTLRTHLGLEAARAAAALGDEVLGDPAQVAVDISGALSSAAALAARIDPHRAGSWPAPRPAPGGTAAVCAADRWGRMVSLLVSNYQGFGSGLVVDGWGIALHNRGSLFRLDPTHPNGIAPGRRPLHTLAPAWCRRGGAPWAALATMGGHAQPQVLLQVLQRMVDDGVGPGEAVAAPRWVAFPSAPVLLEAGAADPSGLRRRGHEVVEWPSRTSTAGHLQLVAVLDDGYVAVADPRSEGAACGC